MVVLFFCGCYSEGANGYSQEQGSIPTERVIIVHENKDSPSDIMRMNQQQQMINMEQSRQNMENLNNTMDRMRGTMTRYGRTIDSANKMRQRNSNSIWDQ